MGDVIAPSNAEYDQARRGFNAPIDRRPAVVARCAGAADVATAFAFAQANGLEVAVRGGGHNPAGHCVYTPGGVVGSTGVAGQTFGGGIGHLTAQFGLICDHLTAAELVTPSGEQVRASVDENPDLLWALRGAGGNFGVATTLEFRLHPLDHVIGGLLVYRGAGVRDVLRCATKISRQQREPVC
ncbi:MAG TPA: FAD-binding protein [Gaiellaceae bacterium]|nr:FAD-binding protein [Gaiellaceae bacterium]